MSKIWGNKWLDKWNDGSQWASPADWEQWCMRLAFLHHDNVAHKRIPGSEDGPSLLTWRSSRSGLWHIPISSLYAFFKLSFCWVILNSLSLSCWKISFASLSSVSRWSCSSSQRNRRIFWYCALIMTFLKSTYSWGDGMCKWLQRLALNRKPQPSNTISSVLSRKYLTNFVPHISKCLEYLLIFSVHRFSMFLDSFPVQIKPSKGSQTLLLCCSITYFLSYLNFLFFCSYAWFF